MNVDLLGRVRSWGMVDRGSLIRTYLGQTDLLGMKVWIGAKDAIVSLVPGREGTLPGLVNGSDTLNTSHVVYELSDARIRPDMLHLQLTHNASFPGDLLLSEGGTFLHALGLPQDCVDIATGEVVPPPGAPFVIVKQWSIVHLIDGQASAPIFSWP